MQTMPVPVVRIPRKISFLRNLGYERTAYFIDLEVKSKCWFFECGEDNFLAIVETGDRLARDVRMLGNALGTVLKEQGGADLYDLVERIRTLTKEMRDDVNSEAAKAELDKIVIGMDLRTAQLVLKSFTTYFQLVNLAEQKEIVRVNRRRAFEAESSAAPGVSPRCDQASQRARCFGGRCCRTGRLSLYQAGIHRSPHRVTKKKHFGKAAPDLVLDQQRRTANALGDRDFRPAGRYCRRD